MIQLQLPPDENGIRITTGCSSDPVGTPLQMARTLYLQSCSQGMDGEYVLWDTTCKHDYVVLKSGKRSARRQWIREQVELGRFTKEQLTETCLPEDR